VFAGWVLGACSGISATCTLTMDAAKSVVAGFAPPSAALTVNTTSVGLVPGGAGSVSWSPPGVPCVVMCSAFFLTGTVVTLTATPAPGSQFAGWVFGACSGSALTCTLTMDVPKSVTAGFAPPSFPLRVSTAGPGAGTVSWNPPGTPCIVGCSALFLAGTAVTITATPAVGSTFANWAGDCAGTTPSCTVTLSAARNVSAVFR
jgi:hypothetical protein